jgi:hypothetical protein
MSQRLSLVEIWTLVVLRVCKAIQELRQPHCIIHGCVEAQPLHRFRQGDLNYAFALLHLHLTRIAANRL